MHLLVYCSAAGKSNIDSKSDMIGAAKASSAVMFSTESLYRSYGYPFKIVVFTGSSDSASSCTIKGMKLEYSGGAAAVGQSVGVVRAAQLSNITQDPVIGVSYQLTR